MICPYPCSIPSVPAPVRKRTHCYIFICNLANSADLFVDTGSAPVICIVHSTRPFRIIPIDACGLISRCSDVLYHEIHRHHHQYQQELEQEEAIPWWGRLQGQRQVGEAGAQGEETEGPGTVSQG